MKSIEVYNWHYKDGWDELPEYFMTTNPIITNNRFFAKEYVGWYCQVYTNDEDMKPFSDWMRRSMKGKYECNYRFNSGDPSFFVHITDAEDANFFRLTWL